MRKGAIVLVVGLFAVAAVVFAFVLFGDVREDAAESEAPAETAKAPEAIGDDSIPEADTAEEPDSSTDVEESPASDEESAAAVEEAPVPEILPVETPADRAAIECLLCLLADKDEMVRRYAAEALGRIGPAAADALPGLLEILSDGEADPDTRAKAFTAIAKIDPGYAGYDEAVYAILTGRKSELILEIINGMEEAGTAAGRFVPDLFELVDAGESEEAYKAISVLGSIAPDDYRVCGFLLALADKKGWKRYSLRGAVSRIKPIPRSFLIEALGSKWRSLARQLIIWMEDDDDVVSLLAEARMHSRPEVRLGAVFAMHRQLPRREEIIPLLIDALDDRGKDISRQAANGLARVGDGPEIDCSRIAALLSSPNEDTRKYAMESLSSLGPRAVGAAFELAAFARRDDKYRPRACRALAAMGRSVVPLLIPFLRSEDDETREAGCDALATMGPDAAGATLELVKIAVDPENATNSHAADALEKIGPAARAAIPYLIDGLGNHRSGSLYDALCAVATGDIPAIMKCLASDDDTLRKAGIRAVEMTGPPARSAVPALTWLLRESTTSYDRQQIIKALAAIGPAARSAVPAVLAGLDLSAERKEDRSQFIQEVRVFARFGPDAAAVVPILLEAIKVDKNRSVRDSELEALGNIGPPAAAAVPRLIELLKDESRKGRWEAVAEALGKIGPAASSALPALETLAKECPKYREELRGYIGRAVYSIAPDSPKSLEILLRMTGTGGLDEAARILEYKPWDRHTILTTLELLKEDKEYKPFLDSLKVEAIPALAEALSDKEKYPHYDILNKLLKLGHDLDPYFAEALCTSELSFNPDPFYKAGVGGIDYLIETLREGDSAAKLNGIVMLEKLLRRGDDFEPRVEEIIEIIVKQFKDERPTVRATAARLLGSIRKEYPHPLREELFALLDDSYMSARHQAITALGEYRPLTNEIIEVFIAALGSDYPNYKPCAAAGLVHCGPDRIDEAIRAIIAASSDDKDYVRQGMAKALGLILESR